MDRPHLVYPFSSGWPLGHFHLLAIRNNDGMNICVQFLSGNMFH